jgi:hypothetical protein
MVNPWMLYSYRQLVGAYFEIDVEYTNTLCGHNAEEIGYNK